MPPSPTLTRVLTAAVLVPLVLAILWWAPTWLFLIAVELVVVLAVREFFELCAAAGLHTNRVNRAWAMLCSLGIGFSQYDATRFEDDVIGMIGMPNPLLGMRADSWLLVFILGVALVTLFRSGDLPKMFGASVASAGALLFVAFPLSFIVLIRRDLLLLLLITVWVGDSAAYFVGRSFGKHLLAPQISPKKTWEGAIANMLFSVAAYAAGMFVYATMNPPPVFSWHDLLGFGIVISITGQVGDLLESAFKRSAGVKDSGSLLPGHGGLLDRIDALILAIPAFWAYFTLVRGM